ncbi:sensor domain-containing diguanylate cyclase [Chitinilyticum litopenaei]|uniref:sensor domain-containing diguanylate cyclase n=1 Tax=Chitinilyticum litopenaei TaxID=1121276 RepID=UPI00041A3EC6|nr:sensor domain-containing diguanylate cyclase [Chitinilyticum litopenaei]
MPALTSPAEFPPEAWCALLDALPLPVTLTRFADGRFLYANRVALARIQRSIDYLRNEHLAEDFYCTPFGRAGLQMQLREPDSMAHLELELRDPAGGIVPVRVAVRRLQLAGEDCVLGVIDERGNATRKALTRTRQLLDAVLANMPGMAYRCTPANGWQMDYVSQGALHLTGYPASHWPGQAPDFAALIHPEHREAHAIALASGEGYGIEYRLLHRDGVARWVHEQAWLVEDEQGQVIGREGIISDISARKADEAAREASAGQYRELVEAARSIILRLDPAGHITFINQFAQTHFGFAPEELLGQPLLGTLMPEQESTRRDLREVLAGLLANPEQFAVHVNENLCKDGRRVWMLWTNQALHDADGQLSEILSIGNDITEQRQIQIELRRAHEQLQLQYQRIAALQGQLREQAIRDPLTGLFNRRYLEETLERELARATREHSPLSVVMLDMDHFKLINDHYGHKVGDDVLRALGAYLRARSRDEDVACRYGGEEFVILLPGARLEDAQRRAESWREGFAALALSDDEQTPHPRVTLSLGVASYPQHAGDGETLLKRADDALYAAKAGGRNRVEVASQPDAATD